MKVELSAFAREWIDSLEAVEEVARTQPKHDEAVATLVDRATRLLAAATLVDVPLEVANGRWLIASTSGAMKLVSAAAEIYLLSDLDEAGTDVSGTQFSAALEILRERAPDMEERRVPDLDAVVAGDLDPARAKIAQSLNPLQTPPETETDENEFEIRSAFFRIKDKDQGSTPGESWEVALEGWERFFQENITDLLDSGAGSRNRFLAAIAALIGFARGLATGFEEALDDLLPQGLGSRPKPDAGSDREGEPPTGAEALVEDLERLQNFLATAKARGQKSLIRREIPRSVFISTSSEDVGKTIDAKTAALWYAEALHELGMATEPEVLSNPELVDKLISGAIARRPKSEEGKGPTVGRTGSGVQSQGSYVVDLADCWLEANAGEPFNPSPEQVRAMSEFAQALWELRDELNVTFFDRTGLASRLVDELVPSLNLGSRGVLRLRRISDERISDLVQKTFLEADYDLSRPLADEAARSLSEFAGKSLGLDQRINRIIDRVAIEHGDRVERSDGGDSGRVLREVTPADLGTALRRRDPERAERALEKLDGLIGLSTVKHQIQRIEKVVLANERARSLGLPAANHNLNFLFLGSPGTGKSTVAELMGEILGGLGAVSSGHLVTRNPGMLKGRHLGDAGTNINQAMEEALGGILLIDDAYGLAPDGEGRGNPYGQDAINTLVEGMDRMRDDLVVILAGYEFEMSELLSMNPGLTSRFPDHLQLRFDDYNDEELLSILFLMLEGNGFEFDDLFREAAENRINRARDSKDFAGARGVRNLAELIEGNQMVRVIDSEVPDEEFRTLLVEDLVESKLPKVPPSLAPPPDPDRPAAGLEAAEGADGRSQEEQESELDRQRRRFREAREGLDSLIGLEPVKKQVNRIANRIFYNKRLVDAGHLPEESSGSRGGNHMVFTGNPGTGKTTVAELLAQMLTAIGVVTDRKVEKVSASDLTGRFMGHTSDNVRKAFMGARGKVLFIDEAYALAGGAKSLDGDKNYGDEAIDELVFLMDEYRHEVVVVVAGYPEPMNDFLNSNPGLRGRFNHFVDFPDYDADELLQIAVKIAGDQHYTLSPDAQQKVKKLFKELIRDRNFANGRTARKLVDDLTDAVAERNQDEDLDSADRDQLFTIQTEDVGAVEKALRDSRELDGEALRELLEESERDLADLDLPVEVERKLVSLMKRAARFEAGDQLADPAFDLIFVADSHQADKTLAVTRTLANFLERIGRLRSADVVEFRATQYRRAREKTTTERIEETIEAANGGTLLVEDAHLLPPASLSAIAGSLTEDQLISIILRVPDVKGLNQLMGQDPVIEKRMEAVPLNLNIEKTDPEEGPDG